MPASVPRGTWSPERGEERSARRKVRDHPRSSCDGVPDAVRGHKRTRSDGAPGPLSDRSEDCGLGGRAEEEPVTTHVRLVPRGACGHEGLAKSLCPCSPYAAWRCPCLLAARVPTCCPTRCRQRGDSRRLGEIRACRHGRAALIGAVGPGPGLAATSATKARLLVRSPRPASPGTSRARGTEGKGYRGEERIGANSSARSIDVPRETSRQPHPGGAPGKPLPRRHCAAVLSVARRLVGWPRIEQPALGPCGGRERVRDDGVLKGCSTRGGMHRRRSESCAGASCRTRLRDRGDVLHRAGWPRSTERRGR